VSGASFRLLLDQGIPRDTAALLRAVGYECVHVGEIGMSKAEDREILSLASEQGATVVTLDADFHALLAVASANGPSVIRIRIQGLDAPAVGELVQHVFDRFSDVADRWLGLTPACFSFRMGCPCLI
jgi:predicted nuclease of predicted toxin-antitoxin system